MLLDFLNRNTRYYFCYFSNALFQNQIFVNIQSLSNERLYKQNNFFQLHTGDFRQYMIRTPYKIPKICVQVALLFEWWNVIATLNKKNKKWGNYMYM